MKEEQAIQDALDKWLTEQNIYFIRSRMDMPTTIRKGAPDFHILHVNRVLLIEVKTDKEPLSTDQKKLHAKLLRYSGIIVYVCRSIEEAVMFVNAWLGTLPRVNPSPEPEKPAGEARRSLPEAKCPASQYSEIRIGKWGGAHWLYGKNSLGVWCGIRPATDSDFPHFAR